MIKDNRPNAVNMSEEVDIFEEDFWNFMQPLQDKAEGYEFFADISDNDEFISRGIPYKMRLSMVWAGFILAFGIVVAIYIRYVTPILLDKQQYMEMQTIEDEGIYTRLQRVSGEDRRVETLADISVMLSRYFQTLNTKENYEFLNSYCKEGSTFSSTVKDYLSKMEYSYDEYDCYARVIKEFGSFCSLVRINDIIFKDGTYYVYADLTIPAEGDIEEYIHLYSYNMTKHFTSNEVTSANIVGYLLDLTKTTPIPCRTAEYCLEVKKIGNEYYLVNDNAIFETCNSSYVYAIERITQKLGGNIITDGLSLD